MLSGERQLEIINIIRESGVAEVEYLAKTLGVSTMTIRRDLKKLDESGLIERCYGGAVRKTEVTYEAKRIKNHESKIKIAANAAKYVHDGMAVFLDAGTTTFEIAKNIMNINNLTIVTNDIEIASLLVNSDCDLIICGGTVQKSTKSVYGYYAMDMIKKFSFDIGFFGAASINDKLQVMTPTIEKAFLKKIVIEQCRVSILAVDNSKFGRDGLHIINELSDYTAVITDREFSSEESRLLDKSAKT